LANEILEICAKIDESDDQSACMSNESVIVNQYQLALVDNVLVAVASDNKHEPKITIIYHNSFILACTEDKIRGETC
jgi:hypothetical protein